LQLLLKFEEQKNGNQLPLDSGADADVSASVVMLPAVIIASAMAYASVATAAGGPAAREISADMANAANRSRIKVTPVV
jgi:hypothetical protein